MNSVNLLEKLFAPSQLGLSQEETSFTQQTIMDAYLSAVSQETNRQILGFDSISFLKDTQNMGNGLFLDTKNFDNIKSIDLFKEYTPEIDASTQSGNNLGKFSIDLNKNANHDFEINNGALSVTQVQQEANIQEETELDSYTKIGNKAGSGKQRSPKAKIDKNNIGEFMANERRRLLK